VFWHVLIILASDILCEMLEQFAYSYIDQVEPGWVIDTMQGAGVPFEMLFEAYLVIFDSKVCTD
jgi:hypothetical protein